MHTLLTARERQWGGVSPVPTLPGDRSDDRTTCLYSDPFIPSVFVQAPSFSRCYDFVHTLRRIRLLLPVNLFLEVNPLKFPPRPCPSCTYNKAKRGISPNCSCRHLHKHRRQRHFVVHGIIPINYRCLRQRRIAKLSTNNIM